VSPEARGRGPSEGGPDSGEAQLSPEAASARDTAVNRVRQAIGLIDDFVAGRGPTNASQVRRLPPTPEQAEARRAAARAAIALEEQRSAELGALIARIEHPKVKHVTVGSGVAATLSHATQRAGQGAAPGPVRDLPEAIAISESPDWWRILGDRDIGQPVTHYESVGYRHQPGDFNPDHTGRARASDVAYANAMTALDSGMVTLKGRVTAIERLSGEEQWPVRTAWRLQVDDEKWIYADLVAYAGGLGSPTKHNAFVRAPELERQLRSTGRLTDAQQQLVPTVGEGETVLIIGGGGTAGWAAQEAVRNGRKATIITRDPSLGGVPPHVRRELDSHGVHVLEGQVIRAESGGSGVVLGVLRKDKSSFEVSGAGVSLAIGQTPNLPRGLEERVFRMKRRQLNGKERVVALEAIDQITNEPTGLTIHGAAMATPAFKQGPKPYVQDRDEFVAALDRQANDLDVPEDSRGVEPSIHQSAINVPLSNEVPE